MSSAVHGRVPGRLPQLARQLAPSVASASQRGSQLVVLWALTAAAGDTSKAQLLTGFGLIATFVMISDSGAGTFLLARRGRQLTSSAFVRACGVHLVVSLGGVLACAGFLAVVLQRPVSGLTVLVLVALGISQLEDNLSRVVRYPLLNREHNVAFAGPELVCSVLKIGLAGWAGVSASLYPLLGLPVVGLLVIVAAVRPVRAALYPDVGAPPAVRSILTFGVTGAINATYTQLPLIFASLILSNEKAAILSTFMRVFQALEIVPGTLGLQAIPRYAAGRRQLGRDWLAMTAGAVVLALAFLPFVPLIGRLLDLPLAITLALPFAGAFVARVGGYLVSAFAMGTGQIGLRLKITVAAAVVMLPVVPLLVHTFDLTGGALAALLSEALLAAGVAVGLRRAGPPPVVTAHAAAVEEAATPAPRVDRLPST